MNILPAFCPYNAPYEWVLSVLRFAVLADSCAKTKRSRNATGPKFLLMFDKPRGIDDITGPLFLGVEGDVCNGAERRARICRL